jgi:hypothetical protein
MTSEIAMNNEWALFTIMVIAITVSAILTAFTARDGRCRKRGHKWRPKYWGELGTEVCARRGCDVQRIDPILLRLPREPRED